MTCEECGVQASGRGVRGACAGRRPRGGVPAGGAGGRLGQGHRAAFRRYRSDRGEALGASHGIDGAVNQALLLRLWSGAGQQNKRAKQGERTLHGSPPGSGASLPLSLRGGVTGGGLKIAAPALMPRKPNLKVRRPNLMRTDRLGYVAGGIALIVWALRRPGL